MYVIKQTYKPCNDEVYMDVCGVFWEQEEGVDILLMTRELASKLVTYFKMMDIAGGDTDYDYSAVNEEDVCIR